MAPDRGSQRSSSASDMQGSLHRRRSDERMDRRNSTEPLAPKKFLAERASQPQFTLRGVLVGLAVGVVICFSNIYFGLQTGWVSSMSMSSALVGFAYFKLVSRLLTRRFTPVENVLVQSVAGSVGTMPLGCGFVGVIPALNFLLKPEENGPLSISVWRLTIWALGICFFGVVFAVPLRKQVIIREKLPFPSGSATAVMIRVLHGEEKARKYVAAQERRASGQGNIEEEQQLLAPAESEEEVPLRSSDEDQGAEIEDDVASESEWKAQVRLLFIAFGGSALYTLVSYFIPQLHHVPILGATLAQDWLWTLNPSPAYIGQGIIMGPSTSLHMLLGAIIGWGVLSPLAKHKGWAPGPVSKWENGSKGWIVWVSLAIMLADSIVSLGWLILRPFVVYARNYLPVVRPILSEHSWKEIFTLKISTRRGYSQIDDNSTIDPITAIKHHLDADPEPDAPPEHLISNRTTFIGLVLSLIFCIIAVHVSFPHTIPLQLTILSLILALVFSIMGVRALGETDLNPVSGISKITQLIFALITPTTGPAAKNSVTINLLAGAISESAALQAGDLLQDLKCGHLCGAAPNAQFWGQMIGSAVGAVVSAVVYKLYTHVYTIPGGLFEVPTAYVWVFTARLVTGKGLPPKVLEWATGAAVIFSVGTVVRIWGKSRDRRGLSAWWVNWIPGGVAVAIGMYNTPSFTLARALGGLIKLWWSQYLGKTDDTGIIILASGLVLGEGLLSIVNLLLALFKVPHL